MKTSHARTVALLLVILGAARCSGRGTPTRPHEAADTLTANPAPWGQLELVDILLSPEEELLRMGVESACSHPRTRWHLRGHTRASVERLFDAASVTPPVREDLWRSLVECRGDPAQGCIFDVDMDALARLGPASRSVLYRELASNPENAEHASAFHKPPANMEKWLAGLRLPKAARAQIQDLLYSDHGLLYFADFQLMCSRLRSTEERIELLRALTRSRGLQARVRVPPGTRVDELVRFWSADGRRQDLRPLLEPLSRQPGGGTIDVKELLPPLARDRLYSYAPGKNCFWTAFNFFSEAPEDRFVRIAEVSAAARSDYQMIQAPDLRLGDVILYLLPGGAVAHAANYIAGDIVFTKNGGSPLWPFTLARSSEVGRIYPHAKEIYLRRRLPSFSALGKVQARGDQKSGERCCGY